MADPAGLALSGVSTVEDVLRGGMMNVATIIEHWKQTGRVDIVLDDARRDAVTGSEHLVIDEAREVLIYQDYRLTTIKGAFAALYSALDVLGLPDKEEWIHIQQQAELLKAAIEGA